MDESHCLQALRYVERNPERAGLVDDPADWPWSSARAHLGLTEDGLVDPQALDWLVADWAGFLVDAPPEVTVEALRTHTKTGRPLGSPDFVAKLEQRTDRRLRPAERGRPRAGETRCPSGG